MHIRKQGIITSEYDITDLGIIDWSRLNGSWRHPGEAIQTISSWFLGKAGYTVIECDLQVFPDRADWPGWNHIGEMHQYLGHLFWNSFHASCTGTLIMSDSPDFYGTITLEDNYIQRFWGDIGQVSAQAFAMTQKQMLAHDLWISVLDSYHQVIIESLYDIQERYAYTIGIR